VRYSGIIVRFHIHSNEGSPVMTPSFSATNKMWCIRHTFPRKLNYVLFVVMHVRLLYANKVQLCKCGKKMPMKRTSIQYFSKNIAPTIIYMDGQFDDLEVAAKTFFFLSKK